MRIVDGHAHVCSKNFDVEVLKNYLEEHKIDRVVLCGKQPHHKSGSKYGALSKWWRKGRHEERNVALSKHFELENKRIQEIARQLPEQVIATYWVNPLEEGCVARLDTYYQEHPFRLIKLHQCWTHFDLEDNCVLEILEWARGHECPVFIHLLSQEQITKFIKVANQFQDVKFITAHLIGAKEMMVQLKSRNVYFDLSAPDRYSLKTLRQVLNHFGAARLIVGSDASYGKHHIDQIIDKLKKASAKEVELAYICRKNLLRVLALN
ncbi:MAG: amidohydrolase family protein [Cellulosilyticaceae bacterium]